MDVELTMSFEWPVNNTASEDEQEIQYRKRVEFWDSATTFEWFKARGYTLYKRAGDEEYLYMDKFIPRVVDDGDYVKGNYPYAHHNTWEMPLEKVYREASNTQGKMAYAQDTHGRHVATKLVLNDSDELRIFQLLKEESLETLEQNCMLPILDIIKIAPRFSVVVMPRWGGLITHPKPYCLGEMLNVMHSLLKGLCFLHSKNILHRDISEKNFLVNCFTNSDYNSSNGKRRDLRTTGELRYAIMDFDISMIVPPETNRATFRLPYWKTWEGSVPQPLDGQADYDPFAFDVGCLGILFCEWTQHHCKDLPFLDSMTARNPSRRFTAQEALEFLDARVSELNNDELSHYYYLSSGRMEYYECCNRWKDVPREPPVPRMVIFMRWLCSFTMFRRLIPYLRWHVSALMK